MTPSDAYEGRLAHPAAAQLPAMVERLRLAAQAAHERRVREWGASVAKAPVTMCPRHPGEPLVADLERSLHASDRAKRVVIVCQPCPACEEDEARRRGDRQLLRRGIPTRSLGVTLETWQPDWEPLFADERAKAWQTVQAWTQGRPAVPFLIIFGTNGGTGKTALGVAALKACSRDFRCLEFRDWIGALLALEPGERAGAIEAVRGYRALMIDDFGNRFGGARDEIGGNAFERDAMAAVLNWRFEQRLPTILTSNLDPAEFARRLDDRTVDRIRAGRVLIDATGWPSRRAAEEAI